ncbi:MAG: iron-sulfur cluster repair di-iron protein [Ekhidna sp.]|nr:iron-sulfur cluster repair di-iron protein [Ekhidna sp.]
MKGLLLSMVFEKTIEEVVDENYVYARALHYLGIDFFENSSRKLSEVCEEQGLDKQQVIKSFYEFDSSTRCSFKELSSYPIDLLVEYLKHTHHIFIKEKLPYIVHFAKTYKNPALRNLMPEFVEDLIRHIYEEEDTTFKYIHALQEINKGYEKAPISRLMYFEDFSLKDELIHHEKEDELGAIRSLFDLLEDGDLHGRVLLSEIKAFDREMTYHAAVENQVLFPKAISLEKQVLKKVASLSKLN